MCEYPKQVLTKFRVDAKVNLRLNFKINCICKVDTKSEQKTKSKFQQREITNLIREQRRRSGILTHPSIELSSVNCEN